MKIYQTHILEKSFPQNEIYERAWRNVLIIIRHSHPEMFLRKGVLEICSPFTGEHPCRSAIWPLLLNYVTFLLLIKKFFVWAKEESGSQIYIVFKKYSLKAINFLEWFSRESIQVRSDITHSLLINYCNSLFKKTTSTLANGNPRFHFKSKSTIFGPLIY